MSGVSGGDVVITGAAGRTGRRKLDTPRGENENESEGKRQSGEVMRSGEKMRLE